MIGSPIYNPVYFLNTSGSYPNEMNRKHEDRKHGNSLIVHYHQRFDKDDVITLQFYSDSATEPVLKSYLGGIELETIALSDSNSIVGDTTRYYYNFEITFDSDYYDKEVTFRVTQDTFTLYSEPVLIEDLTEDINNGVLKIIQYSNLDRTESDINGYYLDWSILSEPLFIYLEAVDRKLNDEENSENIKGSNQIFITSSSLFVGVLIETDMLPAYRVRQIEAITLSDFIAVNGLEYIRQDANSKDIVGNTTSYNVTSKLLQKNAMMINIDDQGVTSDEMEWHKTIKFRGISASVDSAIPLDYMIHTVFVRHAAGSSMGSAIITIGSTSGGTEYLDAEGGVIVSGRNNFPIHDGEKTGVSIGRIYIGVSAGAGVKLNIDIFLELIP